MQARTDRHTLTGMGTPREGREIVYAEEPNRVKWQGGEGRAPVLNFLNL